MLFGRRFFCLACLLVLHPEARGQNFPYEATIVKPEVEVRSLHSVHENAYPTSRLRQGAVVTVVGEKEGGWLAIKPPQGSFSWISSKNIKSEQGQHTVVQEDGVEVRIGSSLVGKKPNVRQVKLNRGDRVVVLREPPQIDEDGTTWVMIQPPANEVRYIPKDAVRATATATAEPPNGTAGAPAAPMPSNAATSDPLWAEAERAEREGRLLDAEKNYTQLLKQTTDNDLKILCHNRIHMIHQANRRAATGYQPAPAAHNRFAPSTAGRPLPPAQSPARATSQYTYVQETPALTGGPAGASATTPQTRGPGLLVRSHVPVAGQQGYLLDMGRGQTILYVIAQPGVNLEPFVGRHVTVSGAIEYHTGYRQNVMRAVQITPH
jgi:hypothetical protein